jgi:hypothetical protein
MINENEELRGCQWLYTPFTSDSALLSSVTTLSSLICLTTFDSSSLLLHDVVTPESNVAAATVVKINFLFMI